MMQEALNEQQIQWIKGPAGVEALCKACGACCASYRVSFYWGETTAAPGGTVPTALTDQLNLHRSCMKGTNCTTPRCVALQGQLGVEVRCSIYHQRASTCREFDAFLEDDTPNPRCNDARRLCGLPPLNVRYLPD